MSKVAATALAGALLFWGCLGDVPFAVPGEGEGGETETANLPCTDFPAARVRRLTRTELNASAGAALGFPVTEATALAAEDRVLGFTNHDRLEVSPLFADQMETVSLQLATKAGVQLEAIAPCAAGTADATCAGRFLDAFVPKAYRRAMTAQERTELLALYQVGRTGADYKTGIQTVIQAVLESASFLYRTELGATDATGTFRQLTPNEVASQISYLITSGPPDAQLLDAANSGALANPDEREAQARRLLQTPAAKTQLKEFVVQWLGLQNLGSLQKNNNSFPDFSVALRDSIKGEADNFLDYALGQEKARLTELLTADYTFVDARLAQFYGLPDRPPGTTFAKVQLPAQRAGILTQAGLLATYAHPDDSSPILRGKLIRTRVLCGTIPPPPPTVVAAPPAPDGTKTTRMRVAAHTNNPSCAGCHSALDPIGFGMEDFDGIGKFRTTENTLPIDASGELAGTLDPAHEGTFSGGAALARMLAQNTNTADCVSTQVFRFGMGRKEQDLDMCSLKPALSRFRGNQLDLKELFISQVRSTSFVQRRVTP